MGTSSPSSPLPCLNFSIGKRQPRAINGQCPAVHILGSQNVYSRAEGIADHYWPWAVFYLPVCLPSLFPSDLIPHSSRQILALLYHRRNLLLPHPPPPPLS